MTDKSQPEKRSDEELDAAMKELGMIPLTEQMKNNTLGGFMIHAGIKNPDDFLVWLEQKYESYMRMKAGYLVDGKATPKGEGSDEEMFEWIMSHAAVFGEVLVNYRKAIGCKQDESGTESLST